MNRPDPADYGDLYDVEMKPTPEGDRYMRDIATYGVRRAAARTVIHGLMAAEPEHVDVQDYAEELRREHRTDQQRLARQLRLLLEAMSQQAYDERNAAMVDFARLALKATERVAIPLV